MKHLIPLIGVGLLGASLQAATVAVNPWSPIFKGIDLASGQQIPVTAGERRHEVLCLRVDLTDPDVELFTTPKCTNCSLDTLSENTSHFLEQYGLQAAVNGGFYGSSSGPGDTALGTPDDVYGLTMCTGTVVSANQSGYLALMLFATNNQAFFIPTNSPATNTAGIYTAIASSRNLLVNGVNVGQVNNNDLDPRTAIGVSQDRRYLYLMTLDGRQTGWSDGADFYNTAAWLQRFGAYDGINLDGGGSTTMSMANCQGEAVRLNRSSFVAAYGRERNIGHNFGVRAQPLPTELKELTVEPGTTTAILTWRTETEGTTQVEYGLTANYGSTTPVDQRLLKQHVATLAGLAPGSNYFFRALSTVDGQPFTEACQFSTLTLLQTEQVFGLSQAWRYTTTNQDLTDWKSPGFVDSGWSGPGAGLLYVENSTMVAPRGTALPPPYGQTISRTYYFRTHFTYTGTAAGVSLVFSNYVDDGAVFYLNGAEVSRVRMAAAPTVISYATAANGVPCSGTPQSGDALPNCPDVFALGGTALASLVQGDNVIAVEVHNYGGLAPADIVFGSALLKVSPLAVSPRLLSVREDNWVTLYWNGEGFTLQQSPTLEPDSWSDVPGLVTASPVVLADAPTLFYRLRD